jgi:hypothetical protein
MVDVMGGRPADRARTHLPDRVPSPLVVGTLLSIVNQVAILIADDATVATAVRIGVNYLVPFLVASVGYLTRFRSSSDSDRV